MSEKGGNFVPVFVCGQIYNCALLLPLLLLLFAVYMYVCECVHVLKT